MSQNRVRQQYLITTINAVFCADITLLGKKKHFLFLVLDLGSRLIVGHALQINDFSAEQLVKVLQEVILPRIQWDPTRAGQHQVTYTGAGPEQRQEKRTILHTDNAQVFKSETMQQFAQHHNIQLSRGPQAAHQNQVIERFNQTLKMKLRSFIIHKLIQAGAKSYIHKEALSKLIALYERNASVPEAVHAVIEEYNNTPHRGDRMYKLSPFNCDEALFHQQREQGGVVNAVILAKNDNSPDAIAIAELRAQAIQKYAGQWEQFFLQFRLETNKKLDQANNKLDQANEMLDQANKRQQELVIQNQKLYEQVQQLGAQLQYVAERERLREKEEHERQLIKQRRKQAKRQPVREAITPEEFTRILEIAHNQYGEPYVRARVKVAIALLYLTGLRIANLLLFQRRHLDQLVEHGECEISIIKGGAKRQALYIGAKGQQLLRELGPDIWALHIQQPESDKPLFSGKLNLDKPVSLFMFQKQINAVLQHATVLFKKHLRSHSFRATFVTDLLDQGVPIEKARDLVGHTNIGTTACYARTRIHQKEVRRTMAALNRARAKGFTITKRVTNAGRLPQRNVVTRGPARTRTKC